jgi:hypothetical protein
MEKRLPSNKWNQLRSGGFLLCYLLPIACFGEGTIGLSRAEAMRIGRKIWQNECNGSITGLTSWNAGENFASLGIGHFIWYPENGRGPFEESFPKFRDFAINAHADVPNWLREAAACPWNSRAAFLRDENSPRMKELRSFLARSVDLQTQFMVTRLQSALPKMLEEAVAADRDHVRDQFQRIASSPHGAYPLIDYVNFKGEGTLATERYQGQGWGLLQVLERMNGSGPGPAALEDFSRSAADVLKQRVANSPPHRGEARWLPGWLNRVKTYRANS